jgi:hypothetical protein
LLLPQTRCLGHSLVGLRVVLSMPRRASVMQLS